MNDCNVIQFASESAVVRHKFLVGLKAVHKCHVVGEKFYVTSLRVHFYWWFFE